MLKGLNFRVLRIPFQMQLWFPIVLILLLLPRLDHFSNAPLFVTLWFVTGVLIAGLTVVLHELGHCWAYRRYGQEPSVVLWGLGGLTFGRALPPRQSIVVSLAGPLIEILLLGVPAYLLSRLINPPAQFGNVATLPAFMLSDLIFFALVWGFVNLLPVLPLDGGHVCESVLEIVHGEPRRQTARLISMVVGSVAAIGGLVMFGSTFILLFFGVLVVINAISYFGERNNSDVRYEFTPAPTSVEDDNVLSMEHGRKKRDRRTPTDLVTAGYAALERRDYVGAARVADRLAGKRLNSAQTADAIGLTAWAWLGQRNPARAEEALRELPRGARIEPAQAAVLALSQKEADKAIELMTGALVSGSDTPSRLIGVDLFAEFGMTHRLARGLVDLPNGAGFEAAVALEGLLHRLNRTQDASTVSDVIMLG